MPTTRAAAPTPTPSSARTTGLRQDASSARCASIHRAGEKLFIDYAGPTMALADGSRAHIFVAAMGASSYTFACATPRETMADWLECAWRVR